MTRKILEILICALFFFGCSKKTECEVGDSRPCGVWPCEAERQCSEVTGTWDWCYGVHFIGYGRYSSYDEFLGDHQYFITDFCNRSHCCKCVVTETEEAYAYRMRNTADPELCNNQDDNCDGTIDEGCECYEGESRPCGGQGECMGVQVCARDSDSPPTPGEAHWSDCIGAREPTPETCPPDGLDNDCDGLTDNFVEICNGEDDDCDGQTDEDFECRLGQVGACRTSCGSIGTKFCSDSCSCTLSPEICDQICGEHRTCSWGPCNPPVEICNGRDDDCDGSTDESFACRQGATQSCTTSCGSTGSQTCDSTCNWGTCTPPAETCNGRDDDCDGDTDEGFSCSPIGSSSPCYTSCGSTGIQICDSSCSPGPCLPPAETCNGRDDDCDGSTDEGFNCRQGATQSCATSCGTTGSQTCGSSCSWGTCTPPAETCNNRDDDCDGQTDEDFACRQGSTGTCTTSCGSTGSRTCSSSCSWGTCIPPAESCGNGRDDDCDGSIDEGCCIDADHDGHARVGSCPSGDDCNDSNAAVYPGAIEICDGLDNDCDGTTDVIASRTVANVTTTYEVGCTVGDGCCDSSSIGVVQTAILSPSWFTGMARTRITASVDYAYYASNRSCPGTPAPAEIDLVTVANGTYYRQSRTFACEVQQAECGTTTPWGSFSYTWTFSSGTLPSQTYLDVVHDGDYGVKYRNWRVMVEVDCH
jgi:hypothetical protein